LEWRTTQQREGLLHFLGKKGREKRVEEDPQSDGKKNTQTADAKKLKMGGRGPKIGKNPTRGDKELGRTATGERITGGGREDKKVVIKGGRIAKKNKKQGNSN